jgi:hypothetical protein
MLSDDEILRGCGRHGMSGNRELDEKVRADGGV